jgi:hypothetical protein
VGAPKSGCTRFPLVSEGDVGVDDDSGLAESFAVVTIVSAQSIGLGWENVAGVGGAQAPARLRGPRSGILGAFSVSSTLTDSPSIQTPMSSGGEAGSGVGGLAQWRPLRDSNVMRDRDELPWVL